MKNVTGMYVTWTSSIGVITGCVDKVVKQMNAANELIDWLIVSYDHPVSDNLCTVRLPYNQESVVMFNMSFED